MEALILRNENGHIGLAVVDEARKLNGIVYDTQSKSLIVSFANGESETLDTEIGNQFNSNLLQRKEIYVAHFKDEKFNDDPLDEYVVRLEL
jgi:hypothetical protein